MPLSNKQKNWIIKNQKKHSAKKLAEEIGVSENAVIEFLNTQKKKKTPFYFYIILIGLPVLFFVLLEIGLWIFGCGFNNEQWDTANLEAVEKLVDVSPTTEAVPEEMKVEAPSAEAAPTAAAEAAPEEVKPEAPPAEASESKT